MLGMGKNGKMRWVWVWEMILSPLKFIAASGFWEWNVNNQLHIVGGTETDWEQRLLRQLVGGSPVSIVVVEGR